MPDAYAPNDASAWAAEIHRLSQTAVAALRSRPGYGLLLPADDPIVEQAAGRALLDLTAGCSVEIATKFLTAAAQNLYARRLYDWLVVRDKQTDAYQQISAYMHAIAYRYFVRVGDGPERARMEAADCTQSALVKVFRSRDAVIDPGRFLSWAAKIVTNECSHARLKRPPDESWPEPSDGTDDGNGFEGRLERFFAKPTGDSSAWIDCLIRALRRVPNIQQRTVLALQFVEELGAAEIAALLDTAVGNVHQMVSRAKRLLRQDLEFRDCLTGEDSGQEMGR